MTTVHSGLRLLAGYASGGEVSVIDTDALLGDACDVLETGTPSTLLAAIDSGATRMVMSEGAFHEAGWMSAKAARSRHVSDADLRALIEKEYLPRIPVVAAPRPGDHWMPAAAEVPDRDDREHVQVARLISARIIYSHDRHLWRTGFAPLGHDGYDTRIGYLAAATSLKQTEAGIAVSVRLSGSGASWLASAIANRLRVKPAVSWLVMVASLVAVGYLTLATDPRRQKKFDLVGPPLEKLGDVLERGGKAQHALDSTSPITPPEPLPLEARVGAFLARHPDSNMREITEGLDLTPAERQRLAPMLQHHPSFELSSRWGWAVGRLRTRLETVPAPRPPQLAR